MAMITRTLSKINGNYARNEREMLAIVWALQTLTNYLHGAPIIIIFTDPKPMTFAISDKNPNTKLKRWKAFFKEYFPTFYFKPGKENKVADALSRQYINTLSTSEGTVSLTKVIPSVENPINCFKNQIFINPDLETSKKIKVLFQKQFIQ